jgi:enoyl-CoA hydratase
MQTLRSCFSTENRRRSFLRSFHPLKLIHSEVNICKSGPVRIITINRPSVRNAVDKSTGDALRLAFEEFECDSSLSVAVLTGAGGNFCAGFDLKFLSEADDLIYDPREPGMMGPTRMVLSKPVIAAVEGFAVAGGLELATWCDIRFASTTAVFGVFCRRWGVPLIDGGTVRLPRLIGHSRAMDMILSGRSVDADEAKLFGLVNYLVPEGQALSAAVDYAQKIARFPQVCLKADKESACAQWGKSLKVALEFEAFGGVKPLKEESVRGAARFASGKGRGGDSSNI